MNFAYVDAPLSPLSLNSYKKSVRFDDFSNISTPTDPSNIVNYLRKSSSDGRIITVSRNKIRKKESSTLDHNSNDNLLIMTNSASSTELQTHGNRWNSNNKKNNIAEIHSKWFQTHNLGYFREKIPLLPSEKNLLPRKSSGITDFKAERDRILTKRASFVQKRMKQADIIAQEKIRIQAEHQQAVSDLREGMETSDFSALPDLANKMLAIDPENSVAWTALGLSLEVEADEESLREGSDDGLEKRMAAVECYKKALKFCPSSTNGARVNLGLLLLKLKLPDEALYYLRSAAEHDRKGEFGASGDLVTTLKHLGKNEEAKAAWLAMRGTSFKLDPRLGARSFDLLGWGVDEQF
eukprot:GDKJ01018156.1.p1 GENE.GDKJ01018156.1~~GDKJ01018156.1.p1  ORF type:complete len:352 (-),score=54.60 GDKJ01018156.1:540-1595(-)